MAQNPRKRQSTEHDQDNASESEESVTSAPRSKRARHSSDTSHDDDVSLPEESDVADSEVGGYRSARPSVPLDEREEATSATQIVQNKFSRSLTSHNTAAECAIIEEIICTNFMCHEHLRVQVGPLINFIIGHNGSGKSAVLTALQICLGGKATATNRGQSLKDFIKRDKEWASLSVRIKNQGLGAYRPEEFGQSITVERAFTRAGTSGFKIKNAMGKIISTRRDDLENLLDHFALQLDNPMNVLTQDMARQFLNNSTPSDKYKFFQKGTHLEQLDHDYREVENALEQIFAKTESIREDQKTLEVAYHRAREKAKRAQNSQVLDQQIKKYTRQLAWKLVQEEEEQLERRAKDVVAVDEAILDREKAVEELGQKLEQAEQTKEQALQDLAQRQAEVVPQQAEHDETKAEFDEGKRNLLNIQTDQRQLGESIKMAQSNVDKILEDIEDEKQKLADKDNGQHAQMLVEIEESKLRRIELSTEVEQLQAAVHDQQRSAREAHEAIRPHSEALRSSEAAVREKDGQIRALERGTHDWFNAYHQSLRSLVKEINNNKSRFKEQPLGPLGRHITLLKPKWSSILEKSFGGVLEAFAVTSKADQQTLSDLMKRVGYRGRIFIGSNEAFARPLNEPASDQLTWLRALKFDSELIRRLVIINQSAEQVVLIEDPEEAIRYQTSKPQNVKAILAIHPDKRRGLRLAFAAGGGESTAPIEEWRGAARLQADRQSRINIEKAQLEDLRANQERNEQRAREAQNAVKEATQLQKRTERELSDLREQLQRCEDTIEQLEEQLDAAMPETGKMDALKDSLAEEEATLKMHEEQYTESEVEKTEINRVQRQLFAKLTESGDNLEEVKAKMKKAELKIKHVDATRHNLVLEKNEAHANLRDAEEQRVQAERARQAQQQTVDEHVQQATTSFSDRVPIDEGETADSLEAKLESLRKERKRAEIELGGSHDQIKLAAAEAKRKYAMAVETMRQHDTVVMTLKQALTTRRSRWEKFRALISIRAFAVFTHLLSERQFRGKLLIDHNTKTLDIFIEPDITRASAKGRQTKTLSGGEKSFSTICLLLSLWEAMGSPIRCLDEFDVFMDNVNRDITVRLMIDAARRSIGRQFILITPQGMANVDLAASDVKIHKMHDPERGQQALPFARA